MKTGKTQKLIFIFMFVLVAALTTPVAFRVMDQYEKQSMKQAAYQFINKALILSEFDELEIFQIKDGKIESIFDEKTINVKEITYQDGFITVDNNGGVSFQMSTEKDCIIKNSEDNDVSLSGDCTNMHVGSSMVELETSKEITNNNINVIVGTEFELPSLKIGRRIDHFDVVTTITLNGHAVDKVDTTVIGTKYDVKQIATSKRNKRVAFEKQYTVTIIENAAEIKPHIEETIPVIEEQ